jgi:hypothetical protein
MVRFQKSRFSYLFTYMINSHDNVFLLSSSPRQSVYGCDEVKDYGYGESPLSNDLLVRTDRILLILFFALRRSKYFRNTTTQ